MTNSQFIAAPGKQIVILTRDFDSSPAEVFRAYTSPALLPRWWGPAYLATTVDRMDVRPGGSWRFVQRDPDGHEYAFYGVYHEVTPPLRLVYTFEYEGAPGHVVLSTITFEDLGGKTRLTEQSVFLSTADRDAMLQDGMESGATESLERLAALL